MLLAASEAGLSQAGQRSMNRIQRYAVALSLLGSMSAGANDPVWHPADSAA